MKRFIFAIKVFVIFIIAFCVIYIKNRDFIIQIRKAYKYDTFNVFHWKNIRFTSAEPNKNFVKTQYIIHNPKRFNAFLFGSSRVGNIPLIELPVEVNGINLSWYNMTYSMGIPAENLMTLKSFLRNGVKVKMVILTFDGIAMYTSVDDHKKDLLRMPYQVYENKKIDFFKPYLMTCVDPSIIKQIDEYDFDLHKSDKNLFYEYGGCSNDFSLTENPDMKRYECGVIYYNLKDSYKDIEAFCELCRENDIRLILITNPMYKTTYCSCVDAGYFDFLRKVAHRCEFYNFSSLNNYTTNPSYYYESSHYRPALGLIIEKYLFGTDEVREQIRRDAGDGLFGMKVNAQNIDEVIGALEKQLN